MFHTYTQRQLERLTEGVAFNNLERKELRELVIELLKRVRNLDKRNRILEMVAGRF